MTTFRRLAGAAAVALYAIIVSGATVRLTSSGLACESWPGCEPGSFFPATSHHGFVEFGNRIVSLFPIGLTVATWWAGRRARAPRWVVRLAGVTFLGTIAQAPLGFLTILSDLHPLMVMTHFLLALAVLAGGLAVAVEAWRLDRGAAEPLASPLVRRGGLLLVAAALALVVTGAFATAAGPHPGGSDVSRLGTLVDAVYVHVRASAVYGIGLLLLVAYLVRRGGRAASLSLVLLAVVVAQMVVGETQWRTQLPWGLVLVHVSLAAAIWGLTVLLVYVLWRPPAGLAAAPTRLFKWRTSSASASARRSSAPS
ncbi:MAG: COX15/CtaA family protein [Thermoleophilia bacterium]|nr:COX15/CtaA family protein [Thermoleophilia bacterium]